MQNQINLTPVTQFAQMLKAAELSQQKEIKIPIQQARLMNLAFVELMDKLLQDYEAMIASIKQVSGEEVINVNMDGGGFSDK
jgi:hypothetical protein